METLMKKLEAKKGGKKRLIFSVDEKIAENFNEIMKENHINKSRFIQNFMEQIIGEYKKQK